MLDKMPQGKFRLINEPPRCSPTGRYDGHAGGMRMYGTPHADGRMYASVTSFLSYKADKTGLFAWRRRVGDDVADHIVRQAAENGSVAHELVEFYTQNKIHPGFGSAPLLARAHFENLRGVLDKHVDNIRGSEIQLYNDEMRLAGTIDLVAEFDGVPSIIDFKTNRRSKPPEYLRQYFMQTAVYAHMYGAAYRDDPAHIKQGVVIISREDSIETQYHLVNVSEYKNEWQAALADFHRVMSKEIGVSEASARARRAEMEAIWNR